MKLNRISILFISAVVPLAISPKVGAEERVELAEIPDNSESRTVDDLNAVSSAKEAGLTVVDHGLTENGGWLEINTEIPEGQALATVTTVGGGTWSYGASVNMGGKNPAIHNTCTGGWPTDRRLAWTA